MIDYRGAGLIDDELEEEQGPTARSWLLFKESGRQFCLHRSPNTRQFLFSL
jgi:hypothetical protein